MFRLLVISVFLSCTHGFPKVKQEGNETIDNTDKIVGGQETTIDKHPYQVSLVKDDGQKTYICGGSIIGKRWVLTAAHCTTNAKTITIRTGSTYLSKGGTTYVTKVFIPHPNYNKAIKYDYDVAVLRVPKDIVMSSTVKIVPLAAAGLNVAEGTNAVISGWGKTSANGNVVEILRDLEVPVVNRAKCAANYKKINLQITPRMLCAGFDKGEKDTCKGDSGGPLVLKNGRQIGIVSFGNPCALPNYPGVYCNVASVRNWIKLTTGI